MSRAEPLYFGPDERPLFGWLHRARASSPLGVVVCNPFGYEAICAHRSLRHFAEAAAEAGLPSLRFDYDGTGDSAGDDRDPARLAAWVSSVHHAVAMLRQVGEVERVVLLGVRLGALVATLAAVERSDVDGLIAIAPVVSGKAYLRELRALQMSIGLREPPPGAQVEEGVQEANGFALTADTKAALGQADLVRLERPPAPLVLLLERHDLPGPDAWTERLRSQSVAVDRRRLPGYVEMVLGAEHAQVPEQMVIAVDGWLRDRAEALDSAAAVRAAEVARTPSPRAHLSHGGRPVVETVEHVDDARRLFGVLANPEAPPSRRRGLLLLNAGAVHHIGPNRLYVTLARRWAGLGHAVLRLDMAGIGDSRPRPGNRENVVYTDEAHEDIAQAIAFLRSQPGVVEVHALGLCSGAYNAFKAAVAGLPLDGVTLINPLTFFYKPEAARESATHHVTGEASRYSRRLRSLDAWKKLMRGQVHIQALTGVMARHVGNLMRDQVREVARLAGFSIEDDLAAELTSIAKKQIPLRFIFADGDPGMTLLRTQGGATVEKLRQKGALGIDVIDGPDHTFTPLWSHPVLTAALAAHYDGPPGARR